ncbi:MAG TPA: sigma-70 family RNA polymerase sigma factor [Bacteroidales bacterium]|nr:sigma-70 family RNA polymerase sigma factor [Bacteroidales bacterium]
MIGINQADFDDIFKNLYVPIRNFIYYKSGNVEFSEDIAQDAFLKIWEKREEIRPETVKQLLYTTANNLFLNKLERQKVSFNFRSSFKNDKLAESPEFELEMKEFDARLQTAIASLDDKKRTVFLMNRIDKLTYWQIAESLDITVKAVEKRMEKALAFLKKEINMNI